MTAYILGSHATLHGVTISKKVLTITEIATTKKNTSSCGVSFIGIRARDTIFCHVLTQFPFFSPQCKYIKEA